MTGPGRGPAGADRYRYGGEGDLTRRLTKWLADFERAMPGRLLAYHTYRSDRSTAGFPDWIFAGARGVLPVETKGATEKLRPDQAEWFAMLHRAAVLYPPELWRPDDYRTGRIGDRLSSLAGVKPMAETPIRHLRASDALVSAATKTAAAAGFANVELGQLARAGLELIAERAVSREQLADALERSKLAPGRRGRGDQAST